MIFSSAVDACTSVIYRQMTYFQTCMLISQIIMLVNVLMYRILFLICGAIMRHAQNILNFVLLGLAVRILDLMKLQLDEINLPWHCLRL